MTSVNSALVRFTYPRRQLGRDIAMTAVAVSVSSAAGPTVASAILAAASWPWLFAIDVPIGLLTFGLSLRLLPYTPPSPHRFDSASALLSAVASALLIAGINGIGHEQALPFAMLELVGAAGSGYVLVRRQAALSLPLLPVDLFRRPVFALSVITSVCTFVALGLAFVTLPFYFQDVLGRSQVATGLLMTPWPATVALVAPIAGRLADRYPAGILCGIGLAVLTSGFLLLAALPAEPHAVDYRVADDDLRFRLRRSRRETRPDHCDPAGRRICDARRRAEPAAPSQLCSAPGHAPRRSGPPR